MANKQTDLWRISVRAAGEAEEPASALLERVLGERPVVYTDLETNQRWVSVYAPSPLTKAAARQLQEGLRLLYRWGLSPRGMEVFCHRVRRRDWAEAWKHHFRPLRIARRLIVKPSWRRVEPRPDQVVITLDPGLAFGTGHHPTTAFCLEEIVRSKPGKDVKTFLDVGTGSGILPIAAAKFGYRPIVAIDNSEESVAIATANARRNRVGHKIFYECRDIRKRGAISAVSFDLVCANLISELLCEQRRRLVKLVASGGRLVLAGILARQFREVQHAYESIGMRLLNSRQGGEWRSGTFGRPGEK